VLRRLFLHDATGGVLRHGVGCAICRRAFCHFFMQAGVGKNEARKYRRREISNREWAKKRQSVAKTSENNESAIMKSKKTGVKKRSAGIISAGMKIMASAKVA